MMPVVIAVCQEKSEDRTCFHTGVPFLPDFCSSSYSFRARANSSVKIGRLLLIARKNICGPMAKEGISRAICWILLCRPLNWRCALGISAGVTCTDSDSSCSSFSLPRNSSSCFSSAWICAILALWSRLGAAVSPARRSLSSSASSSLTVLRSSSASRSALFMPGVSLSFIKNSTSTGLLIPVCFEKILLYRSLHPRRCVPVWNHRFRRLAFSAHTAARRSAS